VLPSPRPALLPVLTALLSAAAAPAAITAAAPTATPLALSVGAASVGEMPFNFRPSASPGTAVTLWLEGFDAAIVKLNDEASRVDEATDAAGNDLLAVPEGADDGFGPSVLDTFPRVRDDGAAMMLDLKLPGLATGGGPVTVTGELTVVVATGSAQVASAPVDAAPGEVTLGTHTLQIKSIGPNDWNPDQLELTLTGSAAFVASVKDWKIRDASGAVVCADGPQSTMTMGDHAQLGFPLKGKPTQLKIEAQVYEGLEEVAVPLDLKVGLGLE